MKKVLVLHYSQSGQLTHIINELTNEIHDATLDKIQFDTVHKFPFPWTTPVFFDAMPDCGLEVPYQLEPINYQHEKYDLIILGYQPWFLSPSIPTTSILKDEKFKSILKDTPIITVIGSRNMWINSQESIKKMVLEAGGKLVGNVALADRSQNLIGVITILHWMLTGQKTRKWGIFPFPGVSDEDIKGVAKQGKIINEHLKSDSIENVQGDIIKSGGVPVKVSIKFIEERAKPLFDKWAQLIAKKSLEGKRQFWVNGFKYYLVTVLFVVSPILLTLYFIFILPFTFSKVKKRIKYYQGVTYARK